MWKNIISQIGCSFKYLLKGNIFLSLTHFEIGLLIIKFFWFLIHSENESFLSLRTYSPIIQLSLHSVKCFLYRVEASYFDTIPFIQVWFSPCPFGILSLNVIVVLLPVKFPLYFLLVFFIWGWSQRWMREKDQMSRVHICILTFCHWRFAVMMLPVFWVEILFYSLE